MYTVSNAGAGSSMSNMQAGTRGMSASDWTRIKRLRGASTYVTDNLTTNVDIAPPMARQIPYSPSLLIKPVVGTGKTRRPASFWTDYKASQYADYITSANTGLNGFALKNTRLCSCSSSAVTIKNPGCTKCTVFVHKTIQ